MNILEHSVSANVHVHAYFHSSGSAELSQCPISNCLLTLLDPCYVSRAGGHAIYSWSRLAFEPASTSSYLECKANALYIIIIKFNYIGMYCESPASQAKGQLNSKPTQTYSLVPMHAFRTASDKSCAEAWE